VKVTIEMPFRPELALPRLQLAELLLEHYPAEKADAREHLDSAINEFLEMKMQPSLERARLDRPVRVMPVKKFLNELWAGNIIP
jgi:hypothetical protein